MDIIEVLKNEHLSIVFGGLAGIATAWLTQRVLNRRGLFSYHVNHNRVGLSTQDSIFGDVSVTWNSNPIQHLFFSTMELKNESLNDYENIVVDVYTDDTILLSESSQILDTPNILEFTEKYKNQIHVAKGEAPTDTQKELYGRRREYLMPIFNRGQVIRINYLNSATSNELPSIWLSAIVKGVKVKFRVPQPLIFGVARPTAAIYGVVIGFILLIPLVLFVSNSWLVAIASITYGFVAQVPGAYFIKSLRKLREVVGG